MLPTSAVGRGGPAVIPTAAARRPRPTCPSTPRTSARSGPSPAGNLRLLRIGDEGQTILDLIMAADNTVFAEIHWTL